MRLVTLSHNFLPHLTTFLNHISTVTFFLLHLGQGINVVCYSGNKNARRASQCFWGESAQFKSSTPRIPQSCQSASYSSHFLQARLRVSPRSCFLLLKLHEQNEIWDKGGDISKFFPYSESKSIKCSGHVINIKRGFAGWREAASLGSQWVRREPAGWDVLLAS